MNNKKKIAILAGGLILVAIIAVVVVTYMSNSYRKYASAYKKLFDKGSVECKFDSVMNIDGEDFNSEGVMKIKQNDKGQMLFLLDMITNDSKITQFTDGTYIYNDVDGKKTKFKVGEKESVPSDNEDKDEEFSMELFQQKLSSYLEAGKIKDLKLMDLIDSKYIKNIEKKSTSKGTQYALTFAEEMTSDLVEVFADEQISGKGDAKVTMKVDSLQCTVTVNDDGAVSGSNYVINFKVNLPAKLTGEDKDKALDVKVNLKMTFVKPGEAVDFDLPSKDGYDK